MENISLSIFEHFIELRRRIFYSTLNVIFFSIISYFFYNNIVNLLLKDFSQKLYTYNLTEGFVTKIKISFLSGIFLSIPMLIFQISLFIMPALKSKEKRLVICFIVAAVLTPPDWISQVMLEYH